MRSTTPGAGSCLRPRWAAAYAALGIVSGGLFDNPLVATLLAAVLVLVLGGVASLVAARLRRRRAGR